MKWNEVAKPMYRADYRNHLKDLWNAGDKEVMKFMEQFNEPLINPPIEISRKFLWTYKFLRLNGLLLGEPLIRQRFWKI